ncbi:hypothetical protein BJ138DRAFT_1106859 [Hygrophoropsis aurantiaca]|uniref:Uncharacterized protein n=1 Tax=Hygrophoropsis aurantiaca TaxID=72124 RepID=A0ACB7ZUJ3_9AGAM|nr:hypothetical protein BJ138DRAFT_1106859 [Hygrophoropsis aurantiaca]
MQKETRLPRSATTISMLTDNLGGPPRGPSSRVSAYEQSRNSPMEPDQGKRSSSSGGSQSEPSNDELSPSPGRPSNGPPDGVPPNGGTPGGGGPPGGNGPYNNPLPRVPPYGPPPNAGYPGGGGPPGGGNNPGPYFNPYTHNFGPYALRMKIDIHTDDLPLWDGNPLTAIKYFSEVQEIALIGGSIPYTMGNYLWTKLEDGSSIRAWFATLTIPWKQYVCAHYINYLATIKTYWLGDQWQEDRNHEYINIRILYSQILLNHAPGSEEEVRDVMRTAPISWKAILQMETIYDTFSLQKKVAEHEKELLHAVLSKNQSIVTKDNLSSLRKDLGISTNNRDRRNFKPRTAYITEVESSAEDLCETITHDQTQNINELDGRTSDELAVAEAFAVNRKQRPPPKGGYLFPKADHVVSSV